MFYYVYLASLCRRRSWPEPTFSLRRTSNGLYTCSVCVNDRIYTSGREYDSPEVAKETACCQAYIICRNFSQLDGMYPDRMPGPDGVIQGSPASLPNFSAPPAPPRQGSFGSMSASSANSGAPDPSVRPRRTLPSGSSRAHHQNRNSIAGMPRAPSSHHSGSSSSKTAVRSRTSQLEPALELDRGNYPWQMTPSPATTVIAEDPGAYLSMSPVSTMSDRRSSSSSGSLGSNGSACRCGRPAYRQFERCVDCLSKAAAAVRGSNGYGRYA